MKKIHPLIPVILFLLLWFLLVNFNALNFPSPVDSFVSFFSYLFSPDPVTGLTILEHAYASLKLVFKGVGIAFFLGVILGTLMGRYNFFKDFFDPIIEILRPIPGIAWFPIAILFFGRSGGIFIVFICAFFHILTNTIFGIRKVDKNLIETVKILKASEWQIISKVLIPSAFPYIITGTRMGLGTGFLGLVAAEMLVMSGAGLGFFILLMHSIGHGSKMVAGMIAIGIVGFTLNKTLLMIGNMLKTEYDKD